MNWKEQFQQLSPARKKLVIWIVAGMALMVVISTAYHSSRSATDQPPGLNAKAREIQLEPDLIEKTLLREQRRQLEKLSKELEEIKSAQTTQVQPQVIEPEESFPDIPEPDQLVTPTLPQPPIIQPQPIQVPIETQLVGSITVLSNPDPPIDLPQNDKKKARTVYLPPSFMEASLLTGFDASTSGMGKNNPEPLLLRIQTPAVLPNDVKANLAGCFIIAEAVGRLDKERADVRLVSLSCLSNQGKAIIDTPVKGFVTDSDSKVGLSGRVVSRMGAATARSIVAGFFGGMGEMLKTASTTQATSALGTTSSVDSSQIAKYSVGGGIAEGADSVREFYLDLARQATPVIEVGATKKITVVISEGKELVIEDIGTETL